MVVRIAALASFFFWTGASADVLNISGNFSANNVFPTTGAGDGNGTTFSGSWSLQYDDSGIAITGVGEELVGPIALTSLVLNPNPLGTTTFDLTNTAAMMTYVDGEFLGIVVGGTLNGPETVNYATTDFFVNNAVTTLAPGSVIWSLATATGASRDRSPSVGGTTSGSVTIEAQPTFSDVPASYWAFSYIETLAASGITGGCGGGKYCPENAVTRAQMAVFLERGMRGSSYVPPAASGTVFLDVAQNSFAAAFIEQLAADGITAGCGGQKYCPSAPVTRGQMAVFLLQAKYGAGHTPLPASGIFGDVSLNNQFAPWIEELAGEGITSGCGNGNYCPNASVTRAQMAVFLVRAFALDQPGGAFDCTDANHDGFCDTTSCDSGIALDDSVAKNAAHALGICETTTSGTGFGLISAAFVRANGAAAAHSTQIGIMDGFGSNVTNREGNRLLALATGTARTVAQPNASGSDSFAASGAGTPPPYFPDAGPGCPVSSSINDDIGLELTLRAPTNAKGFSFDSSYYTFDYPEWVCTSYVDQFVALMDPAPTANGNVVFDANGTPHSANSDFIEVCSGCPLGTADLAQTGFDIWGTAGATGWVTTTVPVDGGQEFTLRLTIWDTEDQASDSTAILDNFRWILDPTALGTTR